MRRLKKRRIKRGPIIVQTQIVEVLVRREYALSRRNVGSSPAAAANPVLTCEAAFYKREERDDGRTGIGKR